jgi:hypothetical protein
VSFTNLADRIRANRKSRSPVQDTVDKLFDDISEAIAQGSSFRAIHAQLTREGHHVGRRHNSLFAAYKVIKRRREQQPTASSQLDDAAQRHNAANMTANGSARTSSGQMPTAMIDTRRKINEW